MKATAVTEEVVVGATLELTPEEATTLRFIMQYDSTVPHAIDSDLIFGTKPTEKLGPFMARVKLELNPLVDPLCR